MVSRHSGSLHNPTSGKNRRSTTHYKTVRAFGNDDNMPVDLLVLSCSWQNKGTTYFETRAPQAGQYTPVAQ